MYQELINQNNHLSFRGAWFSCPVPEEKDIFEWNVTNHRRMAHVAWVHIAILGKIENHQNFTYLFLSSTLTTRQCSIELKFEQNVSTIPYGRLVYVR